MRRYWVASTSRDRSRETEFGSPERARVASSPRPHSHRSTSPGSPESVAAAAPPSSTVIEARSRTTTHRRAAVSIATRCPVLSSLGSSDQSPSSMTRRISSGPSRAKVGIEWCHIAGGEFRVNAVDRRFMRHASGPEADRLVGGPPRPRGIRRCVRGEHREQTSVRVWRATRPRPSPAATRAATDPAHARGPCTRSCVRTPQRRGARDDRPSIGDTMGPWRPGVPMRSRSDALHPFERFRRTPRSPSGECTDRSEQSGRTSTVECS